MDSYSVIAAFVLIAVLIFATKTWLWPSWQAIQHFAYPPDSIETKLHLETELIKTAAQIFIGASLTATLILTWRRVRTAEQIVAVAQEGQTTERFTRPVDQLGNANNMTVRLGGIYALERIAKDSQRDHWQVMEILTAFVRENSPQVQDNTVQPIAKDIQAILTVIGRRNPKYDQKKLRLDLTGTYLHQAKLTDANLEHVDFTGANLRTALFLQVNFRGAIFQDTTLQGTTFKQSNLTKCYFKRALMQGADLQGSNLSNADLSDANLSNADLSEAKNVTKEQVESAITNQKTKLPINYSISKTHS